MGKYAENIEIEYIHRVYIRFIQFVSLVRADFLRTTTWSIPQLLLYPLNGNGALETNQQVLWSITCLPPGLRRNTLDLGP